MTLSRRSLFKYVGAGTAALTSVPVLAQEKSPKNPYLPEVWDENYDVVVVGGGGAGMALQASAVYLAAKSIEEKFGRKPRVIYMTPQGKVFDQQMAKEYAKEEDLIFLCGHYEGIDERVLERIVTDYVSIGDYVLTGGELPALVMMDTISRLVPGVLNNDMSAETESFSEGLLEYPQYTRPAIWRDEAVPEVLLSGHHKKLQEWYRRESVIRTAKRRPDMLMQAQLSEEEKELAKQYADLE